MQANKIVLNCKEGATSCI